MRLVVAAMPLLSVLLPIAAEAQAPGSYRGSCTNVSQDGPILSARCRGPNGRYNDTSLDVRQCHGQPVANSFGRLTCGNARGSSEPMPGGDSQGRGYLRPPPRYEDQPGYRDPGDDNGYPPPPPRFRYGAPPPHFGYGAPPPPPDYYGRPDGDPDAPPPPRPRRYDPDQDY